MVGKYRNENKIKLMVGNTGIKLRITLMVGKYSNESKYHTNGREIQGRK
jgi:hypothetical protein